MFKINQGHETVFDFLVSLNFPLARRLNKRLYGKDLPVWNHHTFPGQQIAGSFQPLADMVRDTVNTFKPYKANYHVKQDAISPLRGVGNILKGIATIIAAPLLLIGNLFLHMFTSGSLKEFGRNTARNLEQTTSWIFSGISNVIRGLTQVIATPLTWLLKLPLRKILTTAYGSPLVEDNRGIKKMVVLSDQNFGKASRELHRRFKKSVSRGQPTEINLMDEAKLYNSQSRNYIKLFDRRDGVEVAVDHQPAVEVESLLGNSVVNKP